MRILLSVDDDSVLDAVIHAVSWSLPIAKWDEIHVLHVTEPHLFPTAVESRPMIEDFLSDVVERLSHLPADIETFTTSADPAQAIVREAEGRDVDLIVMGARGEPHDFPLGSVSQKVVSLTDVDVLVVRTPRDADVDLGQRFRALVAVDGSRGSDAGINSFLDKLRVQHAETHLIHVVESRPLMRVLDSTAPAHVAEGRKRGEDVLARARRRFEARGVKVECECCHGSAASQILESARRLDSQVIVVGSHGQSRLSSLMLGTITQRVLRNAPCSVLCARGWTPESAAQSLNWTGEGWEPQTGMA